MPYQARPGRKITYAPHPCAACGTEIVGSPWPTCSDDCAKTRELTLWRRNWRDRRDELRAAGLCVRCGAPALTNRTLCLIDAKAQAVWDEERAERQRVIKARRKLAIEQAERDLLRQANSAARRRLGLPENGYPVPAAVRDLDPARFEG
jgi:hypothetical protein